MKIETKKEGDRTSIILSGELSIRYAPQLRLELEESITSSQEIRVRFSDVETADLSLLQLLCSAGRSARSEGKKLAIGGEIPDPVANLVSGAGYNNHSSYSDHQCVWDEVKTEEVS